MGCAPQSAEPNRLNEHAGWGFAEGSPITQCWPSCGARDGAYLAFGDVPPAGRRRRGARMHGCLTRRRGPAGWASTALKRPARPVGRFRTRQRSPSGRAAVARDREPNGATPGRIRPSRPCRRAAGYPAPPGSEPPAQVARPAGHRAWPGAQWPAGRPPSDQVRYRGLDIRDHRRGWSGTRDSRAPRGSSWRRGRSRGGGARRAGRRTHREILPAVLSAVYLQVPYP